MMAVARLGKEIFEYAQFGEVDFNVDYVDILYATLYVYIPLSVGRILKSNKSPN